MTMQNPSASGTTGAAPSLDDLADQQVTIKASGEDRQMTLREALRLAASGYEATTTNVFERLSTAEQKAHSWDTLVMQSQQDPRGFIERYAAQNGIELAASDAIPGLDVDGLDPEVASFMAAQQREIQNLKNQFGQLQSTSTQTEEMMTFGASHPGVNVTEIVQYAASHGFQQGQLEQAFKAHQADKLLADKQEFEQLVGRTGPGQTEEEAALTRQKLDMNNQIMPGATPQQPGPTQLPGQPPESGPSYDEDGRRHKKSLWETVQTVAGMNDWDLSQPIAAPSGSIPNQPMDGWKQG